MKEFLNRMNDPALLEGKTIYRRANSEPHFGPMESRKGRGQMVTHAELTRKAMQALGAKVLYRAPEAFKLTRRSHSADSYE